MKNEALAEINQAVGGGVCEFGVNGLRFVVRSEEALSRVGRSLATIESSVGWWWGDYLVAWSEWCLEKDETTAAECARDAELRASTLARYARMRAEALAGEQVKWRMHNYYTALFYNQVSRLTQLSNDHHYEALALLGPDRALTTKWLRRAADAGWTRTELRAHIRGEARKNMGLADDPRPAGDTEGLFRARLWARGELARVDDMTAEEAERVLDELRPVVELVGAIAQKLGKESIFSAAPAR